MKFFDITDETRKIILNLCPSINDLHDDHKINFLWLNIFMERMRMNIMRKRTEDSDFKFCNMDDASKEKILIRNQHVFDAQLLLSAMKCCNMSSYYTYEKATMILKTHLDTMSNEKFRNFITFPRYTCELLLVKLHAMNQTNIMTDNQLYEIIKNKQTNEFITIIEQLYEQKRIPVHQKLIISNNTNQICKCCIIFSKNKTDTFNILPNARKIYINLYDESITHVSIMITIYRYGNRGKNKLINCSFVDIHSYVSINESYPHVSINCEPNEFLDSMQSNDWTINCIAMLLKQEYEYYPSMTSETFINSFLIKLENSQNYFVSELRYFRTQIIKKVINIIYAGS